MCGIAGFLSLEQGVLATRTIAQLMCDVITHRGPDDQGFLVDGPLAMGMRRLSIIDLGGGQQPISNEDGKVSVVFNGEIYNYRELRKDLEQRGHRFKTNSDTETIVHLYEEYGIRGVEKLRGMFAYALWDAENRRLVVARDRLGIKPLYYSIGNGRLLFGSELKSLLAVGLDRTIDRQALHDYLSLTYVPAPATIFKAARKLMPGTMLIAERGNVRIERYWELSYEPDPRFRTVQDAIEAVRERVDDAVRSHLVADVPLGVFLSGGVDSATLVACMRRHHSGTLKTFSIGFAEKSFSELDRAREAARHFETEHHELIVTPDAVALIPELVQSFDEPYADSSAIPVLCVSRLARRHVTVALTGEGGDEVFAGYKTYAATRLAGVYRRAVPGPLRALAAWTANRLPVSHGKVSFDYMAKRFVAGATRNDIEAHFSWKAIFDEPAKRALYRELDETLEPTVRLYHQVAARIEPNDLLARLLAIDTHIGLEGDMLVKADRMTMATSLEGRVPLLDHPLVETVASIPSRLKMKGLKTKVLLREAMKDVLPQQTAKGPKQGFNVPIPSWLTGPLRSLVRDTLAPSRIKATGLFRPEPVQALIEAHERRERDHSRDIWTLLMFQAWHDRIAQSTGATEPLRRLVG
ncbi:MAG TPA: asparagine synthase (glutamine-hydrolyzing) [Candidatus Binatia bacterium]